MSNSGAGQIIDWGQIVDQTISAADLIQDIVFNAKNYNEGVRRFDLSHSLASSPITYAIQDAERAGINPLFALGSKGGSVSPIQPNLSKRVSLSQQVANLRNSASAAKAAEASAQKAIADASLTKKKEVSEEKLQSVYDEQVKKLEQEAKTGNALEAKLFEEGKAMYYDNLQRKAQKELYDGKLGKVLPYLDKAAEYYRVIKK
jgi:hypothetical protein